MLTRTWRFRGYRKKATMQNRISFNSLDRKLPSPTSFLNSWRFLMTQLSTSVAKSKAAFGVPGSTIIVAIWKRLPKITYLLRPQEVTWYRYVFSQRSNGERWMSPCNFARFSQSCTTTVKYLRTFFQQEGTSCRCATVTEWRLPRPADWLSWTCCLAISFASSDPTGLLYVYMGSC